MPNHSGVDKQMFNYSTDEKLHGLVYPHFNTIGFVMIKKNSTVLYTHISFTWYIIIILWLLICGFYFRILGDGGKLGACVESSTPFHGGLLLTVGRVSEGWEWGLTVCSVGWERRDRGGDEREEGN